MSHPLDAILFRVLTNLHSIMNKDQKDKIMKLYETLKDPKIFERIQTDHLVPMSEYAHLPSLFYRYMESKHRCKVQVQSAELMEVDCVQHISVNFSYLHSVQVIDTSDFKLYSKSVSNLNQCVAFISLDRVKEVVLDHWSVTEDQSHHSRMDPSLQPQAPLQTHSPGHADFFSSVHDEDFGSLHTYHTAYGQDTLLLSSGSVVLTTHENEQEPQGESHTPPVDESDTDHHQEEQYHCPSCSIFRIFHNKAHPGDCDNVKDFLLDKESALCKALSRDIEKNTRLFILNSLKQSTEDMTDKGLYCKIVALLCKCIGIRIGD